MIEINVKTISSYVKLLGGKKEQIITLPENSSVKALLDVLISMYGDSVKETFFEDYESQKNRWGTSMYINGSNIFALKSLDTMLNSGDEFLILPPIAGG